MDWREKYLIIIAGPTAVGKTKVAMALAKHYRTEIISADARQVYKELTIGTAKPDNEELRTVTHHFIDSHSIADKYDAAQYGEDARRLIYERFEKKDFLIVCGGSGLYIKALVDGFDDIPDIDQAIKESLIAEYNLHGVHWLQKRMRDIDPETLPHLDANNPHRLIRALEVKLGTGQSIRSYQKKKRMTHPFHIIKIGLILPADELYRRIDERMDTMIAAGLFEEASTLYPYRHMQALQTVGYQEIFDFMEGKYDKEEAIRLLKRNSRRYAKRQITWFKKDPDMQWLKPTPVEDIISFIDDARRG